jgi:hypothetical protein
MEKTLINFNEGGFKYPKLPSAWLEWLGGGLVGDLSCWIPPGRWMFSCGYSRGFYLHIYRCNCGKRELRRVFGRKPSQVFTGFPD